METQEQVMDSGRVLGTIARVLGIKHGPEWAVSARTVDRVFGGQWVTSSSLEQVVEAIIRAVWEEHVGLDRPPPSDPLVVGLRRLALVWMQRWDHRLNRIAISGQVPLTESRTTEIFLRLSAVDLGVRVGAAVVLGLVKHGQVDLLEKASRATASAESWTTSASEPTTAAVTPSSPTSAA